MICYNRLAEVYDKLIYEDINYESIGEYVIKALDAQNGRREKYLDLACGTGNLTAVLGSKFDVTYGIDLSNDMLCKAEEKLREDRIKCKFFCMDITDFRIKDKVDLITSCLDSTNYIIEETGLVGYFKCIHETLKDDGIFVFDVNSEYKLREILGNNTYTYDGDDEVFYVWENELEEDCVSMYLTFFLKNGKVYERFDENHLERIYPTSYLIQKLEECGFEIISVNDNYTDKEIGEETERISFVVKKK